LTRHIPGRKLILFLAVPASLLHRNEDQEIDTARRRGEEAHRLAREKGVYDALQQKYLKTMVFAICEDDGTSLLEEYTFSFSYGEEDGECNLELQAGGKTKSLAAGTGVTPLQMKCVSWLPDGLCSTKRSETKRNPPMGRGCLGGGGAGGSVCKGLLLPPEFIVCVYLLFPLSGMRQSRWCAHWAS